MARSRWRGLGPALLGASLSLPGAAHADILYAATGTNRTTSTLYTIDATTGRARARVGDEGAVGFTITGLARDPVGGTLYGVSSHRMPAAGGDTRDRLVQIDVVTGKGTEVGRLLENGAPVRMADISFAPDGTLFGWIAGASGALARIDPATGAVTRLGASGIPKPKGGALARSPRGVVLVAATGDNPGSDAGVDRGRLHVFDPTAAEPRGATLLTGGTSQRLGVFGALVAAPTGELYGVRINHDVSVTGFIETDLVRFDARALAPMTDAGTPDASAADADADANADAGTVVSTDGGAFYVPASVALETIGPTLAVDGGKISVAALAFGLDEDEDLVVNRKDNCPLVANPAQEDRDGDGAGDVCDPEPDVPRPEDVPPPVDEGLPPASDAGTSSGTDADSDGGTPSSREGGCGCVAAGSTPPSTVGAAWAALGLAVARRRRVTKRRRPD